MKHAMTNRIRIAAKTLLLAVLLLMGTTEAMAQEKTNRKENRRQEIASVENSDETQTVLEVFNSPQNGQNRYYLSVGHLGMGDEVLQVMFDPAFELFIPLGGTIAEAIDRLEQMKELSKDKPGTYDEMLGCLAFGFPTDQTETVKVTCRKVLLGRKLEFSLEREGYIRATYVAKSDLGSVLTSLKLHHKLHPKD